MEQGHDVQTPIRFGQFKGAPNVVCRSADIGLSQGHDLRTRGCAGGLEQQGDLFGGREPCSRGTPSPISIQREHPGFLFEPREEVDYGNAARFGRADRRGIKACVDNEGVSSELAEAQFIFVHAQGRIERGADRSGSNGEESDSHLRTILARNRETIVAPESQPVERGDHLFDQNE
jgi:hypothetical protein